MNNKLTITIAFAAGMLGSGVMRYIAPPLAFAQDQPSTVKEIRAERVALVDSSNQIVGVFTTELAAASNGVARTLPGGATVITTPMQVVLKDAKGRDIWHPDAGIKLMPLSIK